MANDTIETIPFPKPPSQVAVNDMSELNSVLEDHTRFFREVGRFNDDLYNILHSGFLVRDFQVENLGADKITAGVIGTDQIYLFDTKFELNGALQQLIVKDGQGTPVTRVEIGKFGAGSDYGIKIRNASGTVVFQATSSTFMDGAIINNATITGAKLIDATVGGVKLEDLAVTTAKLGNSAVTNAKINDLSASKITVSGTLTCTSSTTAINVTSSGVVIFSSGGDIIMKASASGDTNFISLRTSGNTEKGVIGYSVTSDIFSMSNGNGSDLYIDATFGSGNPEVVVRSIGDATVRSTSGNVFIEKTGGAQISVGANLTLSPTTVTVSAGNLRPDTNNSRDLGTTSLKWANMWTVVDHVGDIEFDNGWRLTEADKVYEQMDPKSGILLMNDRWEPVAMFDHMGNLWVRGWIKGLHEFMPPNVAKTESTSEENHGRKETSRLN